jgi:hypothetical protein
LDGKFSFCLELCCELALKKDYSKHVVHYYIERRVLLCLLFIPVVAATIQGYNHKQKGAIMANCELAKKL